MRTTCAASLLIDFTHSHVGARLKLRLPNKSEPANPSELQRAVSCFLSSNMDLCSSAGIVIHISLARRFRENSCVVSNEDDKMDDSNELELQMEDTGKLVLERALETNFANHQGNKPAPDSFQNAL